MKRVADALGDTSSGGRSSSNVIFADLVNQLVESVARLIDIHQPLVETFYGHGYMLQLIRYLQNECDTHADKIFDEFECNRGFGKRARTLLQLGRRTGKSTSATNLNLM